MARFLLSLVPLLALTLGFKLIYLGNLGISDSARLERDLARIVGVAGYRLSRADAPVERFDAELRAGSKDCRANIAVVDPTSVNLRFIRELHRRGFAQRAEFFGAEPASEVPSTYAGSHYIARALAPIGIDRGARPYVLMAWDAGCPPPASGFGGMMVHFRGP